MKYEMEKGIKDFDFSPNSKLLIQSGTALNVFILTKTKKNVLLRGYIRDVLKRTRG